MSVDQAGTTVVEAAPAAAASGFRDPTSLTRWLKILLWVGISLTAIAIASGLVELKLLADLEAGKKLGPDVAEMSDLRQRVIGGVRFVAIITTIVIFAMWIYRANYNARQLGATDMVFTPGWSVGWYFIPIANLWKPYQAMREIWKASAAPANWKDHPRGPILPWWWGLFLFDNFLNQAAFRLALRAQTLPQITEASMLSVVSDAVDIVASLIALALVSQIYRMQMAHRASPSSVEAPAAAAQTQSRCAGSTPNSACPADSKFDRCACPCASAVCRSRKRRSNALPWKIAVVPAA
jgi:hypothetical protein